ncbi:ribokinase [Clostridium sp. AM58-1XD]|uniref:ribokinase n=1 Tax=Clostridium sp. AM58-1XD TaxID=2292307 RepID=UPI000E4913CE|nr:ribokinase [Clostridium sp. AM58-1XD]RGY99611.1 ribokinase [Clostridium sp. AM58-1XD]
MKVLNFGSLNIDYVYRVDHFVGKGETLSSKSLQIFTGGKGLNQSVALGRAGAEVSHAGCIGQDGLFLLDVLQSAGVDVSHVAVLEQIRSGNAIIQNNEEGDNCILLYGGANQAVTREQVDRTLMDFAEGDYLILQNEINELPYIVDRAHEKGMIIVLNPSPMNEKVLELRLEKIDWFILNEIEAGQITGVRERDPDQLITALLEQFPGAKIVLTLGGDGSCYADQERRITQEIYPVDTVDTTAAGDTFTGFFMAEVLHGSSVENALDTAAKAAAIAVSRQGAAPSIPTMEEVAGWK